MSLVGTYRPPCTEGERRLVARLRSHVDMLAGVIGTRHTGKPGALEGAAKYIERQFTDMGDTVARETYRADLADVANLVAERPGSRQPQQIVIVGAHYDSVPLTPGADDNASAVAMLIEAARLLRPLAPGRTLRFVAFTCEEPPHFYTHTMGSQQHACGCRQRGERIVGMICLEMVGYYVTQPRSQQLPPALPRFLRFAFPRRGDFLAAVGNLRSIPLVWTFRRGFRRVSRFPLYAIALPELIHDIRLSDNSSFWDQGYRALMVTDTSFLRNPHYHQLSDTPQTLDYDRLAMATLGVAGGVARLARCRGRVVAD